MGEIDERLSILTPRQREALVHRVTEKLTEQRPAVGVPKRPESLRRIPLSYLQEQLWFLDQLDPGRVAYNVPSVFRLRGALDEKALGRALTAIVARHEALRTAFGAEDGVPYQVVADPAEHPLPVAAAATLEEAVQAAIEEVRRPFDLATGPLVRSLLIRLAPDDHILAVTMHHIVSDGWSTAIFSAELSELYAGREPAALTIGYADFAAWQRDQLVGEAYEAHLAYWEEQLSGLPALEFATDRPRPQVLSTRCGTVQRAVGRGLLDGLRELSKRHDATLFMTLMTAFHAVLTRYSGQDELVVGTTVAGRDSADLEPVIGHFVNVLVLRTDVSGDPTFAELLGRVRATVLEAWRHQQVPFEKVVERLAPPRDTSRNPLVQIGLQLLGRATQATEPELAGLAVEAIDVTPGEHPFDLAVNVTEAPGQLRILAEYSHDLFDEPRIARLLGHLENVLAAVVDDPHLPLSRLPLLSPQERHNVLEAWQGPVKERDLRPVHVRIADVAARHPDVVAARLGDEDMTYAELDRRAGVLARRLRRLGVGRDDVVALLVPRGFDILVGMLGVMKAGGGFVVMDPGHPIRRLEFILADTATRAVVTRSALLDRLPEPAGWTPVLLDSDWYAMEEAAGEPLPELADMQSLAYVLYTSGSTGKPKGVMVEHHGMNTFLHWMAGFLDYSPGDRLLQHMSFIFDFSEAEVFTGLTRGATTVFVPDEQRTDTDVMGRMLAEERIYYVGGPPAILTRIPMAEYPDLKYVINGGEAATGELVNRWNTGDRKVLNGYGPTEVSIACICYICDKRVWTGQPPIGSPMPNRYAYIVDRWDNPQPVGVPGELLIGGDALARGYLNRPELTAERFVHNPFRPGERMYRTGDLAVWNEDGLVQFLGRIDNQVKIHGQRIELEEIESTLVAHADVAEAAVAVHDTPSGRQLVGYLVAAGTQLPSEDELREHLLEDLPPYMVPHVYVALDRLPLTSVGKIDRSALLPPQESVAADSFVPLRTRAEEQIAEILTAVLGVDRIGAEDSFFSLGGNSLQAAQVLFRLAQQGVELRMRDFYATPRVSDLAALLPDGQDAPATTAAPVPTDEEMAFQQQIEELEKRLAEAKAAYAQMHSEEPPC